MVFLLQSDSIDKLGLSPRAFHRLTANGVETVQQFIQCDEDKLQRIRGLGAKSIAEILDIRSELIVGGGGRYQMAASNSISEDGSLGRGELSKLTLEELQGTNIALMGFGSVITEALQKNHITNLGQLLETEPDELCEKVGKLRANKIQEEVNQYITQLRIANAIVVHDGPSFTTNSNKALAELAKKGPIKRARLMTYLTYTDRLTDSASYEDILHFLFSERRDDLEPCILKSWQKKFIENRYQLLQEQLDIDFPISTSSFTNSLIERYSGVMWEIHDGIASYRLASCDEAFEAIMATTKERDRYILQERLKDRTLEAIATELGVTRECIRQRIEIIIRKLRHGPKTVLAKYAYPFTVYDFDEDSFRAVFLLSQYEYRLLQLLYAGVTKQNKAPEEALTDKLIFAAEKDRIKSLLDKPYIVIDGMRLNKNWQDLVVWLAQKHATSTISFETLYGFYLDCIDELGLAGEKGFTCAKTTMMNALSEMPCILWTKNRCVRYYALNNEKAIDLINSLELAKYDNLEISTAKIYRDHPDVMAKYDIRDEYELHNFLKKNRRKIHGVHIEFSRMPGLIIGDGCLENQMVELLRILAPIKGDAFLAECENLYGYKAMSLAANLSEKVQVYYSNGVFQVDQEKLAADEYDVMRTVLVDDYYDWEALKLIYARLYPNRTVNNMNAFNLKQLGFNSTHNYCYSSKYNSATDFFSDKLLSSQSPIDITIFEKQYTAAKQTVRVAAQRLVASRQLFEIEDNIYVFLRDLVRYGVDKATLDDYCEAVAKFLNLNVSFTIPWLESHGFYHHLCEQGFADCFFEGLLLSCPELFECESQSGACSFKKIDSGTC